MRGVIVTMAVVWDNELICLNRITSKSVRHWEFDLQSNKKPVQKVCKKCNVLNLKDFKFEPILKADNQLLLSCSKMKLMVVVVNF